MKKIISFIVIALLITSLFTQSVFADGEESGTEIGEYVNTDTEQSTADTGIGEEQPNVGSVEGYENPFERFYGYVVSHSGQILSSLAFITSCLLLILYKKGIMPMIKGGVHAISKGVSSLKEGANNCSSLGDEVKALISERLDAFGDTLKDIDSNIDSFSSRLDSCEGAMALEKNIKVILSSQIDMLYEIFNSSSLPVYEKERIGEQVSTMKKLLVSIESEEK